MERNRLFSLVFIVILFFLQSLNLPVFLDTDFLLTGLLLLTWWFDFRWILFLSFFSIVSVTSFLNQFFIFPALVYVLFPLFSKRLSFFWRLNFNLYLIVVLSLLLIYLFFSYVLRELKLSFWFFLVAIKNCCWLILISIILRDATCFREN